MVFDFRNSRAVGLRVPAHAAPALALTLTLTLTLALAAGLLLGACGGSRGGRAAGNLFYVHPTPPRCGCILVLPFSNFSSLEGAGMRVAKVVTEELDATGKVHGFPFGTLLEGLQVSMPPVLDVDFALEVASIVEADAILFGTVGGGAGANNKSETRSQLWVDGRLLAANGEVLWAASNLIDPEHGTSWASVVALKTGIHDMVARLAAELHPPRGVIRSACLNETARRAMRGEPVGREAIAGGGLMRKPLVGALPDAIAGQPMTGATAAVVTPPPRPPGAPPLPLAPKKDEEPKAEKKSILGRLQAGVPLVLEGVRFDGRSAKGLQVGGPVLLYLGLMMKKSPELRFQVRAHTDMSGSPADDLRLTRRQAKSVVKKLTRKWRIDGGRLQAVGGGSNHPRQPNITRKGREANRRVEILLVPENGAKAEAGRAR